MFRQPVNTRATSLAPVHQTNIILKKKHTKTKLDKMSSAALPETNPVYGPFFGVMGAASAIIFSGECLICLSYTNQTISTVRLRRALSQPSGTIQHVIPAVSSCLPAFLSAQRIVHSFRTFLRYSSTALPVKR